MRAIMTGLIALLWTVAASAQGYPPAKSCPTYRIDPLQAVRVGFSVRVAPKAVACRTAEAYENAVTEMHRGNFDAYNTMQKLGVCFVSRGTGGPARAANHRGEGRLLLSRTSARRRRSVGLDRCVHDSLCALDKNFPPRQNE